MPSNENVRRFYLRVNAALVVFFATIGLLLFTEHRAHVLGFLPWLLPLACLFMHFFMHGGEGHQGERGTGNEQRHI